jgi:WD40 repeat protein
LTCIAWNPSSDDNFMFATGGHDGLVRVWTKNDLQSTMSTPVNRSLTPLEMHRTESPMPMHLQDDAYQPGLLQPRAPPLPPLMHMDNNSGALSGITLTSDFQTSPPAREQRSVAFIVTPEEDTFYDVPQGPTD